MILEVLEVQENVLLEEKESIVEEKPGKESEEVQKATDEQKDKHSCSLVEPDNPCKCIPKEKVEPTKNGGEKVTNVTSLTSDDPECVSQNTQKVEDAKVTHEGAESTHQKPPKNSYQEGPEKTEFAGEVPDIDPYEVAVPAFVLSEEQKGKASDRAQIGHKSNEKATCYVKAAAV